jgi:hypothetical protein
MDDEPDSVTDRYSDLEHPAAVVGADQHGESVEVEDPDRVAVGVEHVGVGDPVLSSVARTTGSTSSSYLDRVTLSPGPTAHCRAANGTQPAIWAILGSKRWRRRRLIEALKTPVSTTILTS